MPIPINLPINHFPEGMHVIFAEIWLHTDLYLVQNEKCQMKSGRPMGTPVFFGNLKANRTNYLVDGMPVSLRAEAFDPLGNLRAFQEVTIEWNNKTVKVFSK